MMAGPVGWAWTFPLELSTGSCTVGSSVRTVKCVAGGIDGAPTFWLLEVWNRKQRWC